MGYSTTCKVCKHLPVWEKAIGMFDSGEPCRSCVEMDDNWNITSKFEKKEKEEDS